MTSRENVPLAPFTTFGIGGPARFFIEAAGEEEIQTAIAQARASGLPLFPLGGGSNILVPDGGVDGVVLKVTDESIAFEMLGSDQLLVAGAGAGWDDVVHAATMRGLFGIENLAGIPGTIGGAAVQNIGAYGAALSETFLYADALDAATGARVRIDAATAAFGYRTSLFKRSRELVIMRVALRLSSTGSANVSYPDLAHAQAAGEALDTPARIASALRAIRGAKFPDLSREGTAGSFFANPVLTEEEAYALKARYLEMPVFTLPETTQIKVPLAWLLDHALGLKGFSRGAVRLYEKQPLVVVAAKGATSAEVDALADDVATRVRKTIGIVLEREVETFGVRSPA